MKPSVTAERVGYVLFFIINALMWGNLLAGLPSLRTHPMSSLLLFQYLFAGASACTQIFVATRVCAAIRRETLVLSRILMRQDAIQSDMTMN